MKKSSSIDYTYNKIQISHARVAVAAMATAAGTAAATAAAAVAAGVVPATKKLIFKSRQQVSSLSSLQVAFGDNDEKKLDTTSKKFSLKRSPQKIESDG